MYQFLTGGNVACAATLRTRRGTPAVFPFLPINPIPFRTRFARKSKWRFGIAARPPQRVSKSGLPPQKGAQRAPAQHPCEVATIFFRVLTDNVCARIPAPGRSVAFMQTTSASLASTAPPASRVRRKAELPRRYRKSNFSTECGQICLRSRAAVSVHRRG